MTQNGVTQESVFILRRLGDVFPFAAPEYASMPGQVYWLGTLALLTMIGLALASRTLLRNRAGEISLFKWYAPRRASAAGRGDQMWRGG